MSQVKEALERIRDLPDKELAQALDRARDELFRLQLGLYTNQVENPLSVRAKRREIARILTVIRRRELGLEAQAEGTAAAADATDLGKED
jgi:large subunit ribosomal protein L29